MKKPFLTLVVLLLTTLTMVLFVSCQKEKTNETPTTQIDASSQEAINRIIEFKKQVEQCNDHHNTRNSNYISITDAVWNLEALFNYSYAYPELCYGRTVMVDTVMRLPVSQNDSVSMSELTTFYGKMFATVGEIYRNVTLPNKQFILLDVEKGDYNNGSVDIILHSVQGSVDVTPSHGRDPFQPGEWWYYGENGGGWNSNEGDAAQMLTWWVNHELTPEPPAEGFYTYLRIQTRTSDGPSHYPYENSIYAVPDLYCEFEVVGNPYVADSCLILNSEQLNFHFHGELDLVQNRLYEYGQNDPRVPFMVAITDEHENDIPRNYTRIHHQTTAWYGERTLITQDSNERGELDP